MTRLKSFTRKKFLNIIIALLFICISFGINGLDEYSKNDTYVNGGWLHSNTLEGEQTWPDFWQARVNNPYARPHELAVAKWVIANGYTDCDINTAYAAYEEANVTISNNNDNNSEVSSNTNNVTATNEVNGTNSITLSEENQGAYVVLSKKVVYSAYTSDKKEIGSLSKGTEVTVTGDTSNGYYQFTYTNEAGETVDAYLLYKNKDNIVDKETYDAAWSETSNVEATCTQDGYIEYTNTLSGLTRREEIKAGGHVLGDEKLIKEPGLFTKGEIVTRCAVCNEIIETRQLNSYLPIWSLGVVAILILGIISAIIIKRKNN